jgi:hypothetical protein
LGDKEKVSVFEFLKAPLVRRYGIEWYKGVELIFKEWKKKG